MEKFKNIYTVYLEDIDPDDGSISQLKAIAEVENEFYAKEITKHLNITEEGGGDGSRTIKYAYSSHFFMLVKQLEYEIEKRIIALNKMKEQ